LSRGRARALAAPSDLHGIRDPYAGEVEPAHVSYVVVGERDRRAEGRCAYGGNPLPLSLGALGMTGCVLQVDPQVIFGAAVSGGVANVSLPIPNSTLLVGTEIFQQGFGFVPVANPLGMLASYSIRATVGRSH
jgi:hypothetical protein